MNLFQMDKRRRLAALCLFALLGGACGFAATARRAQACSCSEPQWNVARKSVTSSDPNVSHEASWPSQGTLSTYNGYAGIMANDGKIGEVHDLEARQ
jgi:hypothetical protein